MLACRKLGGVNGILPIFAIMLTAALIQFRKGRRPGIGVNSPLVGTLGTAQSSSGSDALMFAP